MYVIIHIYLICVLLERIIIIGCLMKLVTPLRLCRYLNNNFTLLHDTFTKIHSVDINLDNIFIYIIYNSLEFLENRFMMSFFFL